MNLRAALRLVVPALALLPAGAGLVLPAPVAGAKEPPRLLSVAETVKDRIVNVGTRDEPSYAVSPRVTTAATIKVAFLPITVGEVVSDTLFAVTIGDVGFRATPADDPHWTEGKTSAKWVFRDEAGEGPLPAPYLTVLASWKGTSLVVKVKGKRRTGLLQRRLGEYESVVPGEFEAQVRFGGQRWSLFGDFGGSGAQTLESTEEGEFLVQKGRLKGTAAASLPSYDTDGPTVDPGYAEDAGFLEYAGGILTITDASVIQSATVAYDGGPEVVINYPLFSTLGYGMPASYTNHTAVYTVIDAWGNKTVLVRHYQVYSLV